MHNSFLWVRRRELRPRAHGALAVFALISTVVACAAPERELPPHASISASVADRASSPEQLASALKLADVGALALERPPAPASIDATDPAFWRACAYVYNPEVRNARRMFLIERARGDSAGQPGPIGLKVEPVDISGANEETELELTFDLLGILGLGPADRAKELAHTTALQSLAELESAMWRARFDVDRARVRVAADLAREEALEQLIAEANEDRARIDILSERGWVASSSVEWSWAIQHMLEGRLAEARADLATRKSELGKASGLPLDAPALSQVPALRLDEDGGADVAADEPSATDLFARLPRLRAMRLACALAEANLRVQIARTWPNIRIGPRSIFHPGVILTGAVLDFELPFPGSLDGEIQAALEECERMREAVEDELLAAAFDAEASRARLIQASSMAASHMRPAERASVSAWRVARARFAVDTNGLDAWSFGLEHRFEPLMALVDALEEAEIARLDYEEARGALAATTQDDRTAEVHP